jgi:polysaccharide deacetylase 2 family uncharacterized protein YibQ
VVFSLGRRWAIAGAAAAVAVVVGAVLLVGDGAVRYVGGARVELPLPDDTPTTPTTSAPSAAAEPPRAEVGPAGPVGALIEDGPFGPLPRIGPDGRLPLAAYARPFAGDPDRAQISLLVTGLGLQADLTDQALRLPGAVSLQFSPYAPEIDGLFERARRAGHEVLLDLPMEPADYPDSDPGPHTLLAHNPTEENLKLLDWLLARAPGYVALAGSGEAFAASGQAGPVLDVLAGRGLGLIEIGADDLEATALAVGLPYVSAPPPLDEDPSVLAIDYALAALEAEALAAGSALGIAQPYPVTLERIGPWAATLAEKGLVLAPVSTYLAAHAGLLPAEPPIDDGATRP